MTAKKSQSVPKVCQENWLQMNPAEKARFCNLCQKNVFDFSEDSNENVEEIVCLRFVSDSQEKSKNKLFNKIARFIKMK